MRLTGVAVLCCLLIAANAVAFTYVAAIAIPTGDAWYFIDTFVRQAVSGDLSFSGFFEQRRAGDHAQPLHRLVLLAHLFLADLDFRLEAVFGVLLGAVTCALIALLLVAQTGPGRARRVVAAIAVFAVGLSLNSTNIYTWSLVSLTWISLLIIVAYWVVVPRLLGGRSGVLLVAFLTFAAGLVVDELVFPLWASLIGALLVQDFPDKPRNAMRLVIGGALGLIGARIFLHLVSGGGVASASAGSFSGVVAMMLGPEGWKAVVAPLADSVVHRIHLVKWFPEHVVYIQVAIASLLLIGHVCFWARAFDTAKRPDARLSILAVAMMLFFYASVAGISLSRASELGADYFHQPRYVIVYQLNVIALLVMFGGSKLTDAAEDGKARFDWRLRTGSVLIALLLASQALLTSEAWDHAKHVRAYAMNAASVMARVAQSPYGDWSDECPPVLVVCRSSAEVRARTMSVIVDNELSLYSARFRRAHGIPRPRESGAVAAPEERRNKGCAVQVLRGGPRVYSVGAGGASTLHHPAQFWFEVPDSAPKVQVFLRKNSLPSVRRGGLVTFSVPREQLQNYAPDDSLEFELYCDGVVAERFVVALVR